MILGTMEWLFLILLFTAISIIFYSTFNGLMKIQSIFIFSIAVIGLILVWGITQSDASMLPNWIQTGSTLMLLIITGMSTYAALEMAKANQNLVKITQDQAIMQEKEMRKKLGIEVSRKIIHEIQSLLKSERDSLRSGFFITHYGRLEKEGKNVDIHYRTPTSIFNNLTWSSDPILQKYLQQIYLLNIKFDEYSKNLKLILKKTYEKERDSLAEFNTFCASLPNPDNTMILEHTGDEVFVMTMADSTSENYSKYPFFNYNRRDLISHLIDAGFKQEMEEYKKIKNTFSEIDDEYKVIFKNLYREWKEEYLVSDDELKSDQSTFI